jgi:hypothetical protein
VSSRGYRGRVLDPRVASGVTRFNVYRGLAGIGFAWNHICSVSNLTSTSTSDSAAPGTGAFYYYLVSGRNDCGESTLGTDSTGALRPEPNPCP